ncbi:MAG TPA: TIGR03435 family protein [Vicinamibacterales bacterium]|nr:TIGR03435 family protein [Vicinamibacterales bacterium]
MQGAVPRLIVLTLSAGAAVLNGQQVQPVNPNEKAAFELTSVKRNTSGEGRTSTRAQPNGGWSATNVRLRAVIARAYEVREFQVDGAPDWVNFDRFDIVGRGPEGTPNSRRFAMLRAMLADRFKLVTHVETREQPLYVLTLARPDGRLGPQLKRSTLPCAAQTTPQPGSDCGVDTSTDNRFGTMSAKGVPMDNIAAALANFAVNRTVVNRTGLEGAFDAELRFATEGAALAVANRSDDASSIFTAVQEQLGLKLQSDRGPVPFIVIDSVQQPTPD